MKRWRLIALLLGVLLLALVAAHKAHGAEGPAASVAEYDALRCSR